MTVALVLCDRIGRSRICICRTPKSCGEGHSHSMKRGCCWFVKSTSKRGTPKRTRTCFISRYEGSGPAEGGPFQRIVYEARSRRILCNVSEKEEKCRMNQYSI